MKRKLAGLSGIFLLLNILLLPSFLSGNSAKNLLFAGTWNVNLKVLYDTCVTSNVAGTYRTLILLVNQRRNVLDVVAQGNTGYKNLRGYIHPSGRFVLLGFNPNGPTYARSSVRYYGKLQDASITGTRIISTIQRGVVCSVIDQFVGKKSF